MTETPITDNPDTGYRSHYAEHEHNKELCRKLELALARRDVLLRDVEWSSYERSTTREGYCCPVCKKFKREGHKAGCWLGSCIERELGDSHD
jgi:hypothetical protein